MKNKMRPNNAKYYAGKYVYIHFCTFLYTHAQFNSLKITKNKRVCMLF